MYRPGHYGVALLVYAPVGAALLAARHPTAAVVGGAVVLGLTHLPDYDQRVPFVSHRGVTHTVGFALLVGAGTGAVAAALPGTGASSVALGAVGFALGALAVGAHLLADVLTPAGVRPFWPVSGRQYSLSLTRADSTVANYALLAAGALVTLGAALAVGSVTGP